MPLRIANSRTDRIAVDFTGLTPAGLASLSVDGVRKANVRHGNRNVELGELFEIDGTPADTIWRLEGDFSAVHSLGAGMTTGEIDADGPVGRHAGAAMRGGRIDVRGAAGDWLGAEIQGGMIRVHGDAGDFVGAAYRGSRRGMTGGAILVDGDAGDQVGARMRRGLIAIGGAAGDWLGMRMLAGTILVFGDCGASPGAAMRRGTIAVLGAEPPALLPTYRLACRAPLPMLRLVGQQLRRESFAIDRLSRLALPVELHHGDLLELGRGEILLSGSEPTATLERR
jgi:formylmethanofuran dehydrogenase subunit C